jgi:hypothetical protein
MPSGSERAIKPVLPRWTVGIALGIFAMLALALEASWVRPMRLPGHRAFPEVLCLLLAAELFTGWDLLDSFPRALVLGLSLALLRSSIHLGHAGPTLAARLVGHLFFGSLAALVAFFATKRMPR